MTDIVESIDAALGCQQCGNPLGSSPSDDFCSDLCQGEWSENRVELPDWYYWDNSCDGWDDEDDPAWTYVPDPTDFGTVPVQLCTDVPEPHPTTSYTFWELARVTMTNQGDGTWTNAEPITFSGPTEMLIAPASWLQTTLPASEPELDAPTTA
jgi:hypothetical protein